ncbi:MAG: AAA family ATPase, partial [Woeseia sp.]|nr:AAA family ATPase [Woeseia sp.]
MSNLKVSLTQLFQELRRRKTFQAAAAYIVFAWVLIEGASVILPAFSAPEWILPSLIVLLAVGLPIAVVISWIFDVSFKGIERTEKLQEPTSASDTKITEAVIAAVRPSIAVPLGTARRRQVTLLRCTFDLVRDAVSATDHEAMLTLREEFDDVVNDAVKRFTGKLIERSGVTYELLFGYPTAYENDALRACAAAFAINLRLGSMMPDVSTRHKASIVGSIGIHSDIVVIEKTAGDEDEITIVGDASQVAAWLQTLAPPGSIILSEKSQRLLRGKVRAESLGVQKNLRTSAGMKIFRAEALVQYDSAVAAIESRTSRMLGRNAELAMLLDRWELAKGREDQFVLVRGEPGIGKSTLIGGFSSRVRQEKSARIVSLYCSPFETSSAFYPVVEYFLGSWPTVADEVVHEAQSNRISELLDKAGLDAADTESLRSVLLAIAATATDRDGPTRRPEDVRKDLLRSLQEYFAALAEQNPVVLIVEDIHWADPSTLEFIDMIMSGGAGLGVLSLLTARPGTNFDWTA